MFLESSLRECKKDVNLKIKNKRFTIIMTGAFSNYHRCFWCQILSSCEFRVIVLEFGGRLLKRVGVSIHSRHQVGRGRSRIISGHENVYDMMVVSDVDT